MKHILRVGFLVASFIFFSAKLHAQEFIDSFNVDFLVNKDGTVSVTEVINYDFGASSRHGIFRNISYKKTNDDGKRYVVGIDGIEVTDGKGVPYQYILTKDKDFITLKIGDPNITISGKHTYIIKYKLSGALTYFDTFSEFYWTPIGADWQVPIVSSTVLVRFDKKFTENQLEGKCYTGPAGSKEQNCNIEARDDLLGFTSKNIQPGNNFTVVTKFPLDYAARLEPKPDRSSAIEKITAILLKTVAVGFYLILPIYLLVKFLKQEKRLKQTAKIVSAWFSAPKTPGGAELTPLETAITANVSAGSKAVPATLISLAQRGYMKIVQKEGKQFAFIKTDKILGESLRDYEKSLYNAIFTGGKSEVSTRELSSNTKFGSVAMKLASEAGKYLEKEKVFEKNPVNTSTGYIVLAVFGVIFMNFLLALVAFIWGRKSAKRTAEGIQTYSEAISLKNFLVSQDPQFDFQAQEMMFFEKLLPYATAFGVEDVWIKRFKDLFSTNPEWYEGQDFARLAVMNSVVASSTRVATSTRSTSGFGSGFSGGHSGGGGGGGGGGSW